MHKIYVFMPLSMAFRIKLVLAIGGLSGQRHHNQNRGQQGGLKTERAQRCVGRGATSWMEKFQAAILLRRVGEGLTYRNAHKNRLQAQRDPRGAAKTRGLDHLVLSQEKRPVGDNPIMW